MTIFNVLSLVGGLALFLYGMHLLSTSLESMSGGVLERTLERSTSNRYKAVLLGAAVTAVIQSSSATTVMAVGFVNGGLMTLSQAVGIVMGANIGTTATAWILSLTGIEGSSILIQLLKPTSFTPVLAAVGVAMVMFSKREKRRTIGSVLCGFAVLMFGMSTMSKAVAPLSDMPQFTEFMTAFSNPILGVLTGALITGIIQSSSASVGILQALSTTGGVTYGIAIPIIMGQNIGTCVTALISCIGASKNAKRTAMVHLYFNVIGSLLFLSAFYITNAFVHFSFLDEPLDPAHIAIIHTTFNVVTTAVLLPASSLLVKLATLSVREKHVEEEEWPLDERFLDMPAFALEQCKNVMERMALLSKETLLLALGAVAEFDEKAIAKVLENEDNIDRYEDRLGTYLVKLSMRKLLPEDSLEIGMFLHMIGDFERISDHAVNLTEVAEEMHTKQISFSPAAQEEIRIFSAALTEIINLSFDAFLREDLLEAKQVEPLEEVIDALQAEIRARHIARLQEGTCTIELGFVLSDLLTNLERVSDHCSNIAATLIQTKNDAFDMHSYLESVKAAGGDQDFTARVESYSKEFRLP
ncbi:MAG TPA: Na/Pi cotransporter family protein [Eubacteriales bacterium]|nr:Na/Pi cotransporter family protein [Eubacteriales bacterium]